MFVPFRLACSLAVAIAYFASARLGLAMLAQPEGVAVFWPASGIAAGALLLLGQQCRIPVAIGIIVSTIAANLMGDRNLPMAVIFGLCNAGEALLFVWLIRRRSEQTFGFSSLRSGLWFFVATAVATAAMAVMATAAIKAVGQSPASAWHIWQAWWQSDAIGIITFAPFLASFGNTDGVPASRRDLLEGIAVFGVLLLVAAITYFAQPDQAAWQVPIPVAAIFPIMLWMAARGQHVFLTAGLLVVALMIVWATTNGLGHFGNPGVPLEDRVVAARVTLLSIAFCCLVLISVFSERRTVEDRLRESERQFRNLAAISPVGIFRANADGKCIYVNARCLEITGMSEAQALGPTWAGAMHPVDVTSVMTMWRSAVERREPMTAEYRFQRRNGQTTWVFDHAIPEYDSAGNVSGYVGTIADITERKRSEEQVDLLMGELNHRSKNLLSVAQAVAFHTAREEDPADFVEAFSERIASLAASHDLLTQNTWEGVDAADLVHSQLAHFGNLLGSQIVLDGPPVRLKPAAAQAIGMALHELATNAGKYGSLTDDKGSVRITWSSDNVFRMQWVESGTRTVEPPKKRGFGHKVMVEMAAHQLGATVRLEYPAGGLVWQLSAPLERTVEKVATAIRGSVGCAS